MMRLAIRIVFVLVATFSMAEGIARAQSPDAGVAAPAPPPVAAAATAAGAGDAGAPVKAQADKKGDKGDKGDKTGKTDKGDEKDKDEKGEKEELKRFDLEGYVNLGLSLSSRPTAVPRDRLTYGLKDTLAGLIVKGSPFKDWKYVVHFGISPESLDVLTGVDLADTNGDGASPSVVTTSDSVTGIGVEEVSVAYEFFDWYEIKAGHFYMPFSPGAQVIITSQMFPARPLPTQVFMSGADQGILNSFSWLDERLQLSLGVFNGSSLGLKIPGTTAVGPVYSFFVDTHPLGKMPSSEGDAIRGPLRFALGFGALYRVGTLYDDTGYSATHFNELRVDGALRVAFQGLFLQGEILRRQQFDDLSRRPAIATGAYAQASYYQPIRRIVALAPLARWGLAIEDQEFAPRKTTSLEAGIAIYPRPDLPEPDALRFILQYSGERRSPETEVAHSGLAHLQFRW